MFRLKTFGPQTKVSPQVNNKTPRKGNIKHGTWRSLRHAYMELRPNMTYVAFYKRVKSGMTPEDAAKTERQKGGRVRRLKLPWEE